MFPSVANRCKVEREKIPRIHYIADSRRDPEIDD